MDVVDGGALGDEHPVLGHARPHVADAVSLAHQPRLRTQRTGEPRRLEKVDAEIHRRDRLPGPERGPGRGAPGRIEERGDDTAVERRSARIPHEVLPHGKGHHGVTGFEDLALHPQEPVEWRVLFHEAQNVEQGVLLRHASILPSARRRTR